MVTHTSKSAKWRQDAVHFFDKARDNSVELVFPVSHFCESQTGLGFIELINLLNSELVASKIKQVKILDATYLYRHTIPEFCCFIDPQKSSPWLLANGEALALFQVDVVVEKWAQQIHTDAFDFWHKRILIDFQGDQQGHGALQEFREIVLREARIASQKGNGLFEENIRFLLEEYAHLGAFLKNAVMVYPTPFNAGMFYVSNHYNLNLTQLCYMVSHQSRKSNKLFSMTNKTKEELIAENDMLKSIIKKVPGHVYWLNKEDVYLGCNECQARHLGLHQPEEICSKTHYDFLAPDEANAVRKLNLEIMQNETSYEGEETVSLLGEAKAYLSQKTPLYDKDGKVIGLLGISIDITDRKKAEEAEIENKVQKVRIEEQEKRQEVFKQVAHDIQSPLVALQMFQQVCNNLPEAEHKILKSVITSIQTITGRMLELEKQDSETQQDFVDNNDSIAVRLAIEEVLRHKGYQYKDKPIQFKFNCEKTHNEAFIQGNYSDFTRMLSNLINNAVEAFEGKPGEVELSIAGNVDRVQVLIKDSGKGMPQSMIEKILNNVLVGTTKKKGHGIGLRQIRDTLQSFHGTMQIESKEGVGTTFCLEFPRIAKPDWILEELTLKPDSTVVILDDDASIHQTWDLHLKAIGDKVELKYFQEGEEAIKFIQAADEKEKIIFLSDFDLRKQKLNGIGVIQKIGQVGQVVIVSSNYLDPEIKDFIKLNTEIKVLPKQFITDLPVFLEKAIADIVWLDDDAMLVNIAKSRAKDMGLSMDIYTKPKLLLENLSKYPKNTKFIFDHDFKGDIDGFELAKQLYNEGYTNLCLFSGTKFLDRMIPHYLQVSYKGTVRNIDTLMVV